MIDLKLCLKSGTPIIWLKTDDYKQAYRYVCSEASGKRVTTWTSACGVLENGEFNVAKQPVTPIAPLTEFQTSLKSNGKSAVLVLFDYHVAIKQPQIWRALLDLQDIMADTLSNIVIISPTVTVPEEISPYVTVIDYPLPTKSDLISLAKQVLSASNCPKQVLSELNIVAMAGYGVGLSRFEYMNILYMLLTSPESMTTEKACQLIKEQKENKLAQGDLLKPLDSSKDFRSIVGLTCMKNFTKRMISGGLGRGILILGVPGAGKTAFCSCLGVETGRPVVQLDFSRLMGGIVGETESKTSKALEIVDALQPSILMIDEIEKGLAGTSGGNGDSGTSKRQGGQFLRWLSDHESDVYVVATANNIDELPTEFLRAERWDTIFFVDLPDEEQGQAILQLYKQTYCLTEDTSAIDITNWTGAEIKSLCRIAKGTGCTLQEASAFIVPIYKVSGDKLDKLRKFASSFAIPANGSKSRTAKVDDSAGKGIGIRRVDA